MSERSREIAGVARPLVVRAASGAGTCHIGSALSIVDILAVLHGDLIGPDDHLLLSKGHAASALYASLAAVGTLDVDEVLVGYCAPGGRLHGHPKRGVPGVEMTGGSLGHGPAIAVGLALAARERPEPSHVWCLVGDGECNEGSVWEAVALAGQLRLDGLTLIVDANGLQGLDRCDQVLGREPLADRFRAFGLEPVEVDGHDHDALRTALHPADGGRPRAVIATTVKGYGVPWFEDELLSHYRPITAAELPAALAGIAAR